MRKDIRSITAVVWNGLTFRLRFFSSTHTRGDVQDGLIWRMKDERNQNRKGKKKITRPEDQHGKEDQYGGPCCIHTNINSIYRQQLVHSLGCSTLFFMIRLRPGPFTSFLRSLCVHDKQKDPQRKEEEEKQIDKRRYLLLIGHSVPQTARYNVYCAALLR